jgi:hypothetical protein
MPMTEDERKIRRKQARDKWRLANPEKDKESRKKWRVANSEKSKESDKRCKARRKDAAKVESERWRLANPERFKEIQRLAGARYYTNHRKECADRDVHTKLAMQLGIPRSQVPIQLLDAKLAVSYVKRKVKELMK